MKRRQIIKIGVLSGLTAVLPKCTNLKETTKDKSKQMTDFRATGNIEETGWPDIRNKKMNWWKSSIRMTYSYEEGYIKTKKGTDVLAYRFMDESLKMELFNRDTKATIHKPASYFKQFEFDLSYNCFGYCFAESSVFVPNPTSFLDEEYEQVEFKDAELIQFKNHNGFGDNGEELIGYFHVVKILPNGNVSFKPGINKLVENVSREKAIYNYNFNHEVYFRKKA